MKAILLLTVSLIFVSLVFSANDCTSKPKVQINQTPLEDTTSSDHTTLAPHLTQTPPAPSTTPEQPATTSIPSPTPIPTSPQPVTEDPFLLVKVSPIEVTAGETQQIEVIAIDIHGNRMKDINVTWKTTDKHAGSVTNAGVFTAGEVVGIFRNAVEVQVSKGGFFRTASASVTITTGRLEQVVIAPDFAEIGIEMAQQFMAVGADRYGNRISNLVVNWSVENDAGTIDGTGLFTAGVKPGTYGNTVKVKATQGSVTLSATASVTIKPDRVLFVSGEAGYMYLYIIDADGNNTQRLVSIHNNYGSFFCSPDGQRILYDSGGVYQKITVISLGESEKLCLLQDDANISHSYPLWSPDGTRILFSSYSDKEHNSDIYLKDANGGNLVKLTDTIDCDESDPSWSPDGTRILFLSYNSKEHDSDIYLVDANGGNLVQLTDTIDRDESSPSWSPDGTQILFSSHFEELDDSDIYLVDVNGGKPVRLTNTIDRDESNPSWSPDGTRITFEANGNTWMMNANGSHKKRLVNDPIWSPDGAKIAFVRNWEIYVMNADGSNTNKLTSSREIIDAEPEWSPDGSNIVYLSGAGVASGPTYWQEDSEIWVMKADGSHKIRLTNNRYEDIYPKWFPRKRGIEVTEDSVVIPKLQ